ncbi:hypothetical protein [Methylorubrum extorquens]|uniref:hypothetical protein n=1 Tax=Methylorubrum extorquens TaxID=408 RepID=UPI001EE52A02|nr:hypothetical protein [Methylorubrum extorquens]MCG5248424.1 hypothetical protein [Methylorubrum extorquens]
MKTPDHRIDPRLVMALEHRTGPVQALVTLRSDVDSRPLEPAVTERSVKTIVDEASRRTHTVPKDVVVFPHMQSFTIEAEPNLIQSILDENELDSASLNAS